MMDARRLLVVVAYLACAVGTAHAHEPDAGHTAIHKALDATFPGKQFDVWDSIDHDLNGDGIKDLAAIVVSFPEHSAREERLLVLAGGVDGNLKLLSVSGVFCTANQFYQFSAPQAGDSFEVKGVMSADAARSASFTFKFRYNAKLSDFELIGREQVSDEYDENSSYRISVNYLTKEVIHSRHLGKSYIERRTTEDGTEKIVEHSRRSGKHKEARTKFDIPVLFRLQGFDCLHWTDPADMPSLYIDEDFNVRR